MNVGKILLEWYVLNKRELPWRNTNNPYFIWLSEIILQQTRVEQGLPYYLRFIKAFPTVSELANAKQDRILKLWQGLGYYSRARNLHFTAKYIMQHYNGKFPSSYPEILNLKGVGTYTAAAISSFCFNLPYAVVDGNVIRFLSRLFGVETAFDTTEGVKIFRELAHNLLDKNIPGEYNQAIMEFGALHCTSKSPKCYECSFAFNCTAYITNSIAKFPVKVKKISLKKRFLDYLLIQKGNSIMLRKRRSGIWKGLYEFPFLESEHEKSSDLIISSCAWVNLFNTSGYKVESISKSFTHRLSHQYIYARFWKVHVQEFTLDNCFFVRNRELKNYPVPRLLDKFMKEDNII